jgi:hypothetical protein
MPAICSPVTASMVPEAACWRGAGPPHWSHPNHAWGAAGGGRGWGLQSHVPHGGASALPRPCSRGGPGAHVTEDKQAVREVCSVQAHTGLRTVVSHCICHWVRGTGCCIVASPVSAGLSYRLCVRPPRQQSLLPSLEATLALMASPSPIWQDVDLLGHGSHAYSWQTSRLGSVSPGICRWAWGLPRA